MSFVELHNELLANERSEAERLLAGTSGQRRRALLGRLLSERKLSSLDICSECHGATVVTKTRQVNLSGRIHTESYNVECHVCFGAGFEPSWPRPSRLEEPCDGSSRPGWF